MSQLQSSSTNSSSGWSRKSKALLLGTFLGVAIGGFFYFSGRVSTPQEENPKALSSSLDIEVSKGRASSDEESVEDDEFIDLFVEVQNEDGAPIVGARVALLGRTGSRSSFNETRNVKGDGLAAFERIPAAIHEVKITAKGYVAAGFAPPRLPDAAKEASVAFILKRPELNNRRHPRNIGDDVKIVQEPILETPFSGAVLSGGEPVQNAQVLRMRKDPKGMDPADVAACDRDGRFSFRALPLADEKNPVTLLLAFHQRYGRVVVDAVEFAPSSKNIGFEIALSLPAGAYIEGKVVDEQGNIRPTFTLYAQPHFLYQSPELWRAQRLLKSLRKKERNAPGVQMALKIFKNMQQGVRLWVKDPLAEDDDKPINRNANRGVKGMEKKEKRAQGSFRIGPVAAGVVTLVASHEEYAPTEIEVELDEGETLEGVVLRLEDPLFVSGSVTDAANGRPISGARIRARMSKGSYIPGFGVGRSDEDGFFRIRTRSGIRHTLSITKRGYTSFEQGGFSGGKGDEKALDVKLRKAKGKRKGRHQPRDYVGIGAQLRVKKNAGIVVERIFKGGAAAQHLQEGDVVIAVDREDVDGQGLRDVVQLILGEPDTDVELTILPKGKQPEQNVVLIRKRVTTGG
ncbi:MAG: PDZ domain-containing protein [Deltaproteobacteria bacterium]|nr:PDZ domain-containing protein [Deltaproteobacteria bacterium]